MKNKFDYAVMQKNFYNNIVETMNENHRRHDVNLDYKNILLKPIEDNKKTLFLNEYALDFGCGHGRNVSNVLLWFPDIFKRVDGVDISEKNIEHCYKNVKAEINDESKYHFYVNNGVDLSELKSNFYIFVMSTITLQHICVHEIRFSLMSEIYRILKDGGIFSFQMGYSPVKSNTLPPWGYYKNKYDVNSSNGFNDVTINDPTNVIDDLQQIGFKNITFTIKNGFEDPNHSKWIYFTCFK